MTVVWVFIVLAAIAVFVSQALRAWARLLNVRAQQLNVEAQKRSLKLLADQQELLDEASARAERLDSEFDEQYFRRIANR